MTSATAALRGPLRKRESHLWARDPHDWYVEPEWVSTRLFQIEHFCGRIWDPACGMGRIVKSAQAAGLEAFGTDIRAGGEDFLTDIVYPAAIQNIVCNPPFKFAEQFVRHALCLAELKVGMLLPANWVQGDTRSRWLETTPLMRVYFIAPRPSMPPGAVVLAGMKPGNGTTDYAWFIWSRAHVGRPEIRWLRRDP